jgi:hypothetical protein
MVSLAGATSTLLESNSKSQKKSANPSAPVSAELTNQLLAKMESSAFTAAEYRISIYGLSVPPSLPM